MIEEEMVIMSFAGAVREPEIEIFKASHFLLVFSHFPLIFSCFLFPVFFSSACFY